MGTVLITKAINQLGTWEPEERQKEAHRVCIRAIDSHSIELLEDALNALESIQGVDEHYVTQVEDLLGQLRPVRDELERAMEMRDPERLAKALQDAKANKLPGLGEAEALLKQLQNAAVSLENAKDAGMLRTALRSAHKARLRTRLITKAINQLGVWEPEERQKEAHRVCIRAIDSHSIELL